MSLPDRSATGRDAPESPLDTPPVSGENQHPVLTVDLLNAAADIMDSRGLAKFAYFDPDGSCCILGAIALARGYDPIEMGPSVSQDDFVEEPLGELAVLMRRDPVAFSDAEWVTQSDVSEALRWTAWSVLDRTENDDAR